LIITVVIAKENQCSIRSRWKWRGW